MHFSYQKRDVSCNALFCHILKGSVIQILPELHIRSGNLNVI